MNTRIAVFASGGGTNFEVVARKVDEGRVRNARIVLLISNNSDAGAMDVARRHGIRAVHMSGRTHPDAAQFEQTLSQLLAEEQVEIILLAGYMKLLPPNIIREFPERILNIHPALLPDFGGKGMHGLNVHRAVIAGGASRTGVTIHYVSEVYDAGRVIRQVSVPVHKNDTPETLAARVLEVEHDLYWRVVDSLIND